MKDVNVQTIKVNERQFFNIWLQLMQPFIRLRYQERIVLAGLLHYRYVIQKSVKNDAAVNNLLFSTQARKEIRKEIGVNASSFNNILTILREKKLIVDNTINTKIIPNVKDDFNNFKLVYDIHVQE